MGRRGAGPGGGVTKPVAGRLADRITCASIAASPDAGTLFLDRNSILTKAAQDLYTYKPSKALDSPFWRDKFEKNLKDDKFRADKWKADLERATKDLGAEQKSSAQNIEEYATLMGAFHADTKSRLGSVMAMIDALGKPDAAETLPILAKKTCDDLLADLDGPLTYIFKASKALQGNREDLSKDADIDKAAKAGNLVPVADLKKLIKAYMAERKQQIDRSKEVSNQYVDKVKTFVLRAQDASKMISKLSALTTKTRDAAKDDLGKMLDEATAYFVTTIDGNFMKPANSLIDLTKMMQIHDNEDFSAALAKSGGKDRIAAFASVVTKQYNAWKIHEKHISLLQSYCKKVDNAKLETKLKSLVTLTLKNKGEGKIYKTNLEGVIKRWKETAALRTDDK